MTEVTAHQLRLLRFWGANMTMAFQVSDWWPGFSYTEPEKARLAALAETIPPRAVALWMYALAPAIFILIAAAAVVGLMLPALALLAPNPADLKPLPFVIVLATVAAVSLTLGLPAAMMLGGRIAVWWTGDTAAVGTQPGDAALYSRFRRQLWRYAIVACGLFIPGCWLWIVLDLRAGPLLLAIKSALVAWIAVSGFVLWRLRA